MELKRVSKEIAIGLQKLGFEFDKSDTKCYLHSEDEFRSLFSVALDIVDGKLPADVERIPAPTQALAVKWLRDARKIQIEIGYDHGRREYDVQISKFSRNGFMPFQRVFRTYEEAEEFAIKRAIEMLS